MARRVQPTFRIALAALIVALVAAAVFAVGAFSLHYGRKNATDLSAQILDQTLHRIDLRIQSFLRVAVRQSRLSRRLLETRQLSDPARPGPWAPSSDDFGRIAGHFTQAIRVHRGLTNLGIGLEATGEFCVVNRRSAGIVSHDYVLGDDGVMRLELYDPRATGRISKGTKPFDGYDPRRRPWYIGVEEADASHWTDVYPFAGSGGGERVPGVTFGTPIRGADGSLVAVTFADYALQSLCVFLDELRREVDGLAFVVEIQHDGSLHAIAHPDPGTLLHTTMGSDGRKLVMLAETVEQMGDPLARTFMAQLSRQMGAEAEGKDVSGTLEVERDGERYFGAYRRLGGDAVPHWVTCMMIPRGAIMAAVERNNRDALWIGLLSFLIAALLSVYVASRVSKPLSRIAVQCEDIGQFELDGPSLGRSRIAELDRLMVATDEMKASLRSFEQYVPARLVREMFRAGAEAELGGEFRTLTVFFARMVGAQELQRQVPPEAFARRLGEGFTEISEEIEATQGTLDKYMGDAVMAFWGAPQPLEDHALAACQAALGATRRLDRLRARWTAAGRPLIHAAVGLNTGELVVGNMGSRTRMSYTVVGDPVNVASRIQGLNRVYGTRILIGESTHAEVADHVLARRLDRVAVKGKQQGVTVYELLAMQAEATPAQRVLATRYDTALDAYFAGRFEEAADAFAGMPGDSPSEVLLARCRAYVQTPPPPDWDGVHVMTEK